MQKLLESVVLVLAVWTLYCYILGLLGTSYWLLFALSWLPLAFALWAFLQLPKEIVKRAAQPEQPSLALPWLVFGTSAAAGIVGVYLYSGSYVLFWVLAAAVLLLGLRLPKRQASEQSESVVPERAGIVVMLCIVALGVTLVAHRPDADDSFYLSVVAGALDHPEQTILRYDDMYGEPNLPLLESAYRLKSYELLLASLNHALGLPAKTMYYLFFPSLFAVLAVGAHWLALREIGGSYAWLGTAVVVLVLIVWGDEHRTFGNFAFVRLFQGKAVLVSVIVPAAVFFASRFARNRTWRNWLLLAAVQITALGISPSAVVVAPLASAAYLLAAATSSRRSKLVVEGLSASVLVIVAGVTIFAMMPIEGDVPRSMDALEKLVVSAGAGIDTVLGHPVRRAIALFVLLVTPFLLSAERRHRVLNCYVLILVLIIMNPVLPGMLGIVTQRFTWRVFWAVPFPLLMGLLAQRLAAYRGPERHIIMAGAVAAGILFVLTPGTWTVSPANETRLDFPRFKVNPEYDIAQSIIENTSPADLVLAPYEVAQWLPTFSNHPRLVGIRPHYYHVLAASGSDEMQERKMLMHFVSYPHFPQHQVKAAIELIKRRDVSLVVMATELPQYEKLAAEFQTKGCRQVDLADPKGKHRFRAWRCSGT